MPWDPFCFLLMKEGVFCRRRQGSKKHPYWPIIKFISLMKLAVPIKYIERRDMYKNNERKLCEEKGLISEKGPVPLSKKKIGARQLKKNSITHINQNWLFKERR